MNSTFLKTGVIIGFLGKMEPRPDGTGSCLNMSLLANPQKLLELAGIKQLEKMVLFLQPPVSDENSAEEFRHYAERQTPGVEIVAERLAVKDLWDYEQVNNALIEFTGRFKFNPAAHNYLIYTSAGTHVAQTCMYLLIEKDLWPGDIIQTIYAQGREDASGDIRIVKTAELKNSLARTLQTQSQQVQRSLTANLNTDDPAFKELIAEIEASAIRSKDNVLLQGKTGTGKTVLARLIAEKRHEYKLLDSNKIVVENCATLYGDIAYSTLFGHKKGAFTGAVGARQGRLKQADKGLLFLDEIGDLGLREQAMLLKAIEEKGFTPLGGEEGNDSVNSDFQLICATNKDLFEEVAAGRFRADLLARINVWTFTLPDFTERRGDMEKLFIAALTDRRLRLKMQPDFEAKAKKKFLTFASSTRAMWTGNYRDLRSTIERMSVLAGDGKVTEAIVDKEIARLRNAWERGRSKDMVNELLGERSRELSRIERAALSCAIEVCRKHENQSAAAEELYGPQRNNSNLSSKLKMLLDKYHLDFKSLKSFI